MRLQYILYLLLVLFYSCTGNKNKKADGANESILKKPPSSFNDTMVINTISAVFYEPDSAQREKINAKTDPKIAESMQHECIYQIRNAKKVLAEQWPQVKITDVIRCRYILFITNSGKNQLIDLDFKQNSCGLFLFDGKQEVRPADMTNIETDLFYYFSSRP